VWAIDTWLLRTHPAELLAVAIEEMFTERLPQYGRFLMGLGLQPPYRWIADLTDVINRLLQFPPPHGQMRMPSGPCPECLSEHIMTPAHMMANSRRSAPSCRFSRKSTINVECLDPIICRSDNQIGRFY
jgi:hypothetical protein